MAKDRGSMKGKSYSVKLTLVGNGGIVKGDCKCMPQEGLDMQPYGSCSNTKQKGMSKSDLLDSSIFETKESR